MKNNNIDKLLLPILIMSLSACESGSFGSDVGDSQNIPPTARAQVLNGGTSGDTFREGSEVILTGKDSEDADGPIIDYEWTQIGGPAVQLVERASATVSFTAPDVSALTDLSFRLAVSDSVNETGDTTVVVTVIPAQDANEFLSLDLRVGEDTTGTFDSFKVVAALADGGATGTDSEPFTLSAKAYIVYPPRNSSDVVCSGDAADLPTSVPGVTASGCLAHVLADLTPGELPGGGTGVAGAWPANAPVPDAGQTFDSKISDAWWNPRYSFSIPRLDMADFNQQFVDSGERDQILEDYNVDDARIFIALDLVASPAMQNFAELILTTADNQPISGPFDSAGMMGSKHRTGSWALLSNSGTGLPASGVVPLETILASIRGRESALTSEVYYRTVDPEGTRTTLNGWLQQAGFASDDAGTLLPAAVDGTGEFAHAVYVNNYDLGFGRDMYMRRDANGNLYSFVVNYPTLEATIREIDPIVTVVMEYSPLGDPAGAGEKFTKFFTYVGNGSGDEVRVGSMNFDGRGERYTPGNCVVCHGGHKPPGVDELVAVPGCTDAASPACYSWPAQNRDGDPIENGNLRATFLPWDLESFLFADTDPAITDAPVRFDGTTVADDLRAEFGDFSRASQEQQLQRLNEAIYSTYCDVAIEPECKTDAARRLVEHWYDVEDGVFTSAFDDSGAPEGWRAGDVVDTPTTENPGLQTVNPPQAEIIYQLVYAQHCRMCHTNITEDSSRFDTYQKFTGEASNKRQDIERTVFRDGIMPAARLTDDRFWTVNELDSSDRSAAEVLAEELGIEPLGPAPTADISGDTLLIDRGDPVFLSAAGSSFASTVNWSVTYTPPIELAGNATFNAFSPTIIGDTSEEASFLAELPGTYDILLAVNGASAPVTDARQITVENFSPNAIPVPLLVSEGATGQISVEEYLTSQCNPAGPRCVEIFGDPDAVLFVDDSTWNNETNGVLTVQDRASGVIFVDANRPGPISDSISYTLTDVDGEVANGLITIDIEALTAPVANNDNVAMDAQTTISPPGNRSTTIAVTANDTPPSEGISLSILPGSVTNASNGTVADTSTTVTYTPNLGFVGIDSFTYRIVDDSPGARVSETALVTVDVQRTSFFGTDVQSAFGQQFSCLDCHGSNASLDWTSFQNVKDLTQSPQNARNSRILTYPSTTNHNSGSPIANWRENATNANDRAAFRSVLAWIEEGAQPDN
jgi:mono/diheme cytochrome c family protein